MLTLYDFINFYFKTPPAPDPFRFGLELRAEGLHLFHDLLLPPPLRQPGLHAADYRGKEADARYAPSFDLNQKNERLVVPFDLIDSVIVDEVAGAVEDRPALMNFNPLEHVAGVSEHDVRPAFHQGMSKGYMFRFRAVAPVRPPMGGNDHEVRILFRFLNKPEEPPGPAVSHVHGNVEHAGGPLPCHPFRLVVRESDERDVHVARAKHGGLRRLPDIRSRSGMMDAGSIENPDRIGKGLVFKIQGMIVGKRGHVDAG